MSEFEDDLVAKASAEKEAYIASGKQCCFRCWFAKTPSHPDHASHYVECHWALMVALPYHCNFGNSPALVSMIGGQNCGTYEEATPREKLKGEKG